MTASIAAWGCLIPIMPTGFKQLIAVKPKWSIACGDAHYTDKAYKDMAGQNTKSQCWPPHPVGTRPKITIGAKDAYGGLPLGAATVTAAGSGGPVSQSALGCFFVDANGTRTATGTVDTNGSGAVTAVSVTQPGWGYTNTGSALFDVITTADPEYWLLRFDQVTRERGWQEYLEYAAKNSAPIYLACDDHDELGDNWDWGVTKAGVATSGAITTKAGVWAYSRIALKAGDAIRQKYFPLTPMPGGQDATATLLPGQYNGDRPDEMVTGLQGATDGSDIRIRYWSKDYDESWVEGGTSHRVLTLDCISYKSLLGVNGANSTMLGAKQEAWLLAQARDAKKKGFNAVVVFSTKDLFNLTNQDGWYNYATQRDRILQAIHDEDLPVWWITFDRHTPHVGIASVATGQSYDAFASCSCPMGNTGGYLDPYQENVAQDNTGTNVFAEIKINSETGMTDVITRDTASGDVVWSFSIPFGRRLPDHDYTRIYRNHPTNLLQVPQAASYSIAPVPATGVAWTNNTGRPGMILVDGGTVTTIQYSGDGGATFTTLSATRTATYMRPGDQMKVNYSSVPTTWKWIPIDTPAVA